MTGELKKFEVTFRLKMPSNSKETEYTIAVMADNEEQAYSKAKAQWINDTYPRDIRVKETMAVITAS